jgi:hypothetical protein
MGMTAGEDVCKLGMEQGLTEHMEREVAGMPLDALQDLGKGSGIHDHFRSAACSTKRTAQIAVISDLDVDLLQSKWSCTGLIRHRLTA